MLRNERGESQTGHKTQDRRKWVTQYMLCLAKGFESSKPGRTGQDKGCRVDLGFLGPFFSCVSDLCECGRIKGKYVSGLDYHHNPSDHPTACHPAQPSLNRRLRREVQDWVWTDGPAGKRETEAERLVAVVEGMGEQTEEWKWEWMKG